MVNGTAAPLYYVSPGQVDFQIPYSTSAGSALVQVISNGLSGGVRRDYRAARGTQPSHLRGRRRQHPRCGPESGLFNQFCYQLRRARLITDGVPDRLGAIGQRRSDRRRRDVVADFQRNADYNRDPGSAPATVTFAGMAPGFVGLMQVDLQTPDVSSNVPLQIQVGAYATNQALVCVGQ